MTQPTPRLTQGTDKCQCTACNAYFKSSRTFDKHRHGSWPDRLCLTSTQMLERDFKQNREGFWMMAGKPGGHMHWKGRNETHLTPPTPDNGVA